MDPVVVLDLDRRNDSYPGGSPPIVFGVSRSDHVPSLASAPPLDVALTSMSDPPAPWVGCSDPDAVLAALRDRIRANPVAAVTLVQVLRADAPSVATGLLLESLAYSTLQAGPEFAAWLAGRAPSSPAPPGDPVLVARAGSRLEITLNRPEVHNAYNAAMRDRLCDALEVAVADPDIAEVVLRGAGPSFCSGGDLTEFGTFEDPAHAHLVRVSRSPARLIWELRDRVAVQVHGACIGSGIELPAFASRVVAQPGATIRLPELGMGLIPGAGGTVSIARRIGRPRTAWMVISGDPIDAATACDWGLVDEISP